MPMCSSYTTESALVKMRFSELRFNVGGYAKDCENSSQQKNLIFSSLDVQYITWPKFVCTFLPVEYFIHPQEATNIGFQIFVNKRLEDVISVYTLYSCSRDSHPQSTNDCQSINGIDASQFYPCLMC